MRLKIRTHVRGHYRSVMSGFDRSLFEQLTPPGTKVELLRFDGSHKGDLVHIRLTMFGLIKQEWLSEITESVTTPEQSWFIDEGRELPFFLKAWRHKHVVEKATSNQSVIVDDITFRTPTLLTDLLMYPIMYLQFAYRKPIYQRVFGRAG